MMLSNGTPENHSRRTQFMGRLVGFVAATSVTARLAYYPPYHSKDHPIEHCWGILETHWMEWLLARLSRGRGPVRQRATLEREGAGGARGDHHLPDQGGRPMSSPSQGSSISMIPSILAAAAHSPTRQAEAANKDSISPFVTRSQPKHRVARIQDQMAFPHTMA